MRLSEIIRFETNERLLNAFNNAIAFIFDINDYIVSICICVKVFSILRYKINNIRSILNELMLIITELRNVHEKDEDRICLEHWKKIIFLTSAILKSLLLLSFNKIIMNQETWTSSAMIRKNNRFFHKKIIKNYISIIIKRFVNAFNEFVKKLSESTWRSSILIFIKISRRILLSFQAAYLNHLCWFQISRHFDYFKSLTSILACDRRVLNDLNEFFNRFLKS